MTVLIIMFMASVLFVPASLFVRPEYALAGIVALLGTVLSRRPIYQTNSLEYLLLLLLAVFSTFTIIIQTLFGTELINRDLMIIARYGYYFCAIATGALLVSEKFITHHVRFGVILFSGFAVALSIVQYFDIGGANSWIVPLYGAKYETLIHGSSWRRTIGTLGNANYWGLFIGFLLLYHCYLMFWEGRVKWLLGAIPLFWVLILSGSRGALISVVLACVIAGVIFFTTSNKKPKFGLIISVTAGGFLVLLFTKIGALYENQGRFSVDNISTLEMRVRYWGEILKEISLSSYEILIGQGPGKLESIRFGDNMYIRLLRDFGLFGLITYLVLLWRFISVTAKRHATAVGVQQTAFGVLLLMLISLAIFDLAADAWFNVRIMGLLLFLYGAIHFSRVNAASEEESR